MSTTIEETPGKRGGKGPDDTKHLHIFVNRRKFEGERIKPRMAGREIAELVGVPPENAVVRRESGPDKMEIGIDESVDIRMAEHFLVTRATVQGGSGA